jgi:hypothetical protein
MDDLPGMLPTLLAVVSVAGVLLLRLRSQAPAMRARERERVALERTTRDALVAEQAEIVAATGAAEEELSRARAALVELEPERRRLADVVAQQAAASAALEVLQGELHRTRALVEEATADLARKQALRAEAEQALRAARDGLTGVVDAPATARPAPTLDLDALTADPGSRHPEEALTGIVRAVRAHEAIPEDAVHEGES